MKTFSLSQPIIFLMRGLPGVGKSTWLKGHHVEDYVISPDAFRLMLSPPVRQENGEMGINQHVSSVAWDMTYSALRSRIEGCLNGSAVGATFVDATFCNKRGMREMIEFIEKYGKELVRIVVVDFLDVPLVYVKSRNEGRKGTIRYVPEDVIDRMFDSGLSMNLDSFGVDVFKPEEITFTQ